MGGVTFFLSTLIRPFVYLKIRSMGFFTALKKMDSYGLLFEKWCGQTLLLVLFVIVSWNLWGPKVAGVPTLVISRFPLGSPRTKCHLDVGLVERHKIHYKGEGDGFPQVRAMVSFMSVSCPWLILAPKGSNYALTTLCLILCRPM